MSGMQQQNWNPWKFATFGILLVLATALITGVVVANYVGNPKTNPAAADQEAMQQPPASGQAEAPALRVPPTPAEGSAPPPRAAAQAPAPSRHARGEPSAAAIKACNSYAHAASRNKTQETLGDTLLGGALGAGLGAAGGAIAGGGGGAGKGAGIGALVGAAGGTLYGLNQANQNDAHAAQAYRACMKRHGYVD